jgi:hypothetical protein
VNDNDKRDGTIMPKLIVAASALLAIAILIAIIVVLGLRLRFGPPSSIDLPVFNIIIGTPLLLILLIMGEVLVVAVAGYFLRDILRTQ